MSLISFLFFLPIFGSIICAFIPHWNHRWIRNVAFSTSLFAFLLSLSLWILFDNSTGRFQFGPSLPSSHRLSLNIKETSLDLLDQEVLKGESVLDATHSVHPSHPVHPSDVMDVMDAQNVMAVTCFEGVTSEPSLFFGYGIDGISLFFIILTTFLIPVCLLVGWTSIGVLVKEYCIAFLLLESLLIAAFSVLDLLLFYIFFESVLVPMFLIIGVWGSRERKIRAAYQFFLYTLIGSLLMLLGILLIYCQGGSTDIEFLYTLPFSETRQLFLWIAFFASFAVKLPMVPVHIWLPEAHVEAPTAGSVILAGILLKLGGYGFLRFSLPLFPMGSLFFTPLVHTLSILAIIYTSLTTLRQIDLKKIIAYSSVAHMNFVTLGLFSLNPQGIEGGLLLMIAHGLVSPALFLCVGFLYERYKTRLLHYYGGCSRTMPLFSIAFLFFTLANISLPGTSNFVGEFLVLTGGFQHNTLVATLGATGMVLGAGYALWLCNRLLFGLGKVYYISSYTDLSRREVFLLFPFIIAVLSLGVLPQFFLDTIHSSVMYNLLITGCTSF